MKFGLILRLKHFPNNETGSKTDRLYKISKLLNAANKVFKNTHSISEMKTVD